MDAEEVGEAEVEIRDALPLVLRSSGEKTAEAVDELFEQVTAGLTEVEAESMGNALRAIGRWVGDRERMGQIAGAVLPLAGTAVGTVYGGPVGAALGGALGKGASQAIAGGGRASGRSRAAGPAAAAPPRSGGTPAAAQLPAGTGSQAAAQLLHVVQNPAFLSSLVSLALGAHGQPTITVGSEDKQVPVGAFANLLTTLASRVTQDADALLAESEGPVDSYLMDDEGAMRCDPAVPSQRADVLLELLAEEAAVAAVDDAGEDDQEDQDWIESWDDDNW
jgi:hypothetical protein